MDFRFVFAHHLFERTYRRNDSGQFVMDWLQEYSHQDPDFCFLQLLQETLKSEGMIVLFN